MAMQKKFNDPVVYSLRVEKETRKKILEKTNNINDFINAAIREKLKKIENKPERG